MSDKTPERKITLGDKTYPLRLTFGVLAKAEGRSGSNFMQPSAWKPLKATDVLALVWAVLGAQETGEHSYEKLADTLVPSMEAYDIHGALIQAWMDGFASVDDGEEAPFAPATVGGGPGPGSTSDSAVPSTTT